MRVLVIEDDASIRTLFGNWLASMPEDPVVVGVPTLTRAYDEIRENRPDVVLLDLGLPDGNGLDAAALLLRLDSEIDLIVPGTEAAAERLGVADFLLKNGINPRTLTRSVRWTARRRADRRALAASERHHRQVVRNLPGAVITVYDRNLRCVLIEGAYLDETKPDLTGAVGNHVTEMGDPNESPKLVEPMNRALAGQSTSITYYSSRTQRHLVVEVLPHRDDRGDIVGILSIARDVTRQRHNDEQRRRAEQRFQIAFERAPAGMALLTLDGRFEQFNAAICKLLGRTREEIAAMRPWDLVHPDDREELFTRFRSLSLAQQHAELETRFFDVTARALWAQVYVTLILDDEGDPVNALAIVEDVTERRREQDDLRRQANQDPLTHLLNRRAFEGAIDEHLARVRRYGPTGALLLLDLDGFKNVNDTHGHAAGDDVLVTCAEALRQRMRETDVIGRIGGDEFGVLIPAGGSEAAEGVAAAILGTLRRSVGELQISASIGVAAVTHRDGTREQLLATADAALYEAKRRGKDRVAVAVPA